MNLEQLRAALQKARETVAAYPGTIKNEDGSDRPMTKEERETYRGHIAAFDDLVEQIKITEDAQRAAAGQQTVDRVPAQPKSTEKAFKSFGEQLAAIAAVGMARDHTGASDRRLKYEKAAGANETVPSEGGFLVQEDFSTAMLDRMMQESPVLGRISNLPLSGPANAIKLPIIDETSRARGSRWGGVRAWWTGEAEQIGDSKPKIAGLSLGLNKLAAMGYATEELLHDASVMGAIMERAFREEMDYELSDSVFNGNGAGKPLGVLNSGAVITVAPESGQAANSVVFNNLTKMLQRMPNSARRNAAWFINDSGIETSLYSITLPGSGGFPVFLPPGQNGATPGNAVIGTLLGKPVIPVEYLGPTGDAGDIVLADMSEYVAISKGGLNAAQSMHVRFIYDEMAFRFTYRFDGKPAWRQPVTTANGEITKSPFVTLGAR